MCIAKKKDRIMIITSEITVQSDTVKLSGSLN